MEIITLNNSKGGCTKTTSAYFIANLLASDSHKKVKQKYKRNRLRTLVIDGDYQSNLSKALLKENYDSTKGGLLEVLKTGDAIPYTQEIGEDFYLIQSTEHLSLFESYFEKELRGKPDALYTLERALTVLVNELEIERIVCDSAPALNQILFQILNLGANWGVPNKVIIPVPVDEFGLDSIGTVTNNLTASLKTNPNLSLIGLLPVLYDSRIKHHNTTISSLKSIYNGLILDTVIPYRAGLVELRNDGFSEEFSKQRKDLEPYYKLLLTIKGDEK